MKGQRVSRGEPKFWESSLPFSWRRTAKGSLGLYTNTMKSSSTPVCERGNEKTASWFHIIESFIHPPLVRRKLWAFGHSFLENVQFIHTKLCKHVTYIYRKNPVDWENQGHINSIPPSVLHFHSPPRYFVRKVVPSSWIDTSPFCLLFTLGYYVVPARDGTQIQWRE